MIRFIVALVLTVYSSVVLGNPLQKDGSDLTGGRIIGGEDADIADYPYQLSVETKQFGSICGAALITPQWALTAAHCAHEVKDNASALSIRAGSSKRASGGQVIVVEAVYEHQDYVDATIANDISLLKLSSNVTVLNSKTIDLATSRPEADQIATVTGWGITNATNHLSNPTVLQVVQIPILAEEDCTEAYSTRYIADTMLCAGLFAEGGKDSCSGDSGGPLVVDGKLAGIVSWGKGCAEAGFPGVYTDVVSYIDWINDILSNN